LTEQVAEVVSLISSDCEPACIIGGVDPAKQEKALARDARVVVGTPGRVLDFLNQGKIRLSKCRFFALDEADEMLSMGFLEDVSKILSKLPKERQGLLVSATITPRVEMLSDRFLRKAKRIEIDVDEDLIPEVDHLYCETGADLMAKPKLLCDLIEARKPTSAIIFCNTKSDTALVETYLRKRGFDARRLNSDLSQGKRQKVMKLIKDKELRFLVATDIAARVIDIEEIEYVFNFAIHEQYETYVHRTGRTGRAGKKGCAISLISPRDFGHFHHIGKMVDLDFQQIEPPAEEEVLAGRLENLKSLLSAKGDKVDERDQKLARLLLEDAGADLSKVEPGAFKGLAALCSEFLRSQLTEEAESIDDELERSESPRKSRSNSESGRDEGDRGNRNRRKKSGDDDTPPEPRQVRLYINRGLQNGLSKEIFSELSKSKLDGLSGEIKNLSLREVCSFIDVDEADEDLVLKGLSGVELEGGDALRLERASKLKPKRPPRQGRGNSRDGRSNRGGSNRGGGGRNDRRSSGRGRSEEGRKRSSGGSSSDSRGRGRSRSERT